MSRSDQARRDVAGHLPVKTFALVVAAIVIGSVAAHASASGNLPVSPTYLQATAAQNGLQVKPLTIAYTGDGTGFLGGAHVQGSNSHLRWTKWTTHVAHGTGYNQLDNCEPSCAGGKYHGYAVKIEMWRPRKLGGTLVFTRLTLWYTKGRPSGTPRHYTFTDTYAHHGYGWGPPTQQGYCTHTYGLKPAAGCKNIHSLP